MQAVIDDKKQKSRLLGVLLIIPQQMALCSVLGIKRGKNVLEGA